MAPRGRPTATAWPGRLPLEVVDGGTRYTVVRAWPRGTDHALLELAPPGGTGRTVAGQWFADDAALEKAARRTPPPARRLAGVLLQPRGADAKLPALAGVLARPGAQLVSHRAGRRAVVRLSGPGTTEYVKVVRPEKAAVLAHRGGLVRELLTGVRVPELLDRDGIDRGVLRWSDVGGITLHDLGADPTRPLAQLRSAWQEAGRAVTRLHDADQARVGRRHGVEEELAAIASWLGPAVHHGLLDGPAVEAATAVVGRALRDAPPRPFLGVLHRDLHDKQLLLREDGTLGMIDVDTLAVGERALDVANLLVHLQLRRSQRLLTGQRAEAADAALRRTLPDDERLWARVPAYAAATRLRLAGVYAFRPRWHHLCRGLLEQAADEAAPAV